MAVPLGDFDLVVGNEVDLLTRLGIIADLDPFPDAGSGSPHP